MGWAVSVRSTPRLRPLLAPGACGSLLGNLFADEGETTTEKIYIHNHFKLLLAVKRPDLMSLLSAFDFLQLARMKPFNSYSLRNLPMAMNISFTFIDVLADVSMKSRLLSSAYDWASCEKTAHSVTARRGVTTFCYGTSGFCEIPDSDLSPPGSPQLSYWPDPPCFLKER